MYSAGFSTGVKPIINDYELADINHLAGWRARETSTDFWSRDQQRSSGLRVKGWTTPEVRCGGWLESAFKGRRVRVSSPQTMAAMRFTPLQLASRVCPVSSPPSTLDLVWDSRLSKTVLPALRKIFLMQFLPYMPMVLGNNITVIYQTALPTVLSSIVYSYFY